jgi:hypothetical protein
MQKARIFGPNSNNLLTFFTAPSPAVDIRKPDRQLISSQIRAKK